MDRTPSTGIRSPPTVSAFSIESKIGTLEDFSRRIDDLKARIDEHKKAKGHEADRADWVAEYVTYPYYKQMIDEQGIVEAQDKADLGKIFLRIVEDPVYGREFVANALRVAERQTGAGKRIVDHICSNAVRHAYGSR